MPAVVIEVQPARVCLTVVTLLALAGCVAAGRPIVAERSPVLTDATIRPASPGAPAAVQAPAHQTASATRYRIEPPSAYLVRRGDTLYSIAWRFELDHRNLARLNNIAAPYRIYPGQLLQLAPAPRSAAAKPTVPQLPAAPASAPLVRSPAPTAAPAAAADWVWPIPQAHISRGFGRANKGIDFKIPEGAEMPVKAANAGEVVYAGNGIGGFERLIIVKHGGGLLSAYNFDGRLKVAEKQNVKAGETIADIKNNGRTSQNLHFELRNRGAPINPKLRLN